MSVIKYLEPWSTYFKPCFVKQFFKFLLLVWLPNFHFSNTYIWLAKGISRVPLIFSPDLQIIIHFSCFSTASLCMDNVIWPFQCCYLFFIKILLKICGFACTLSSHVIKNVYHSMQMSMNYLLLKNESPLKGQALLKTKIFWPPPHKANPLKNENFLASPLISVILQISNFCQFLCPSPGFSRS